MRNIELITSGDEVSIVNSWSIADQIVKPFNEYLVICNNGEVCDMKGEWDVDEIKKKFCIKPHLTRAEAA